MPPKLAVTQLPGSSGRISGRDHVALPSMATHTESDGHDTALSGFDPSTSVTDQAPSPPVGLDDVTTLP